MQANSDLVILIPSYDPRPGNDVATFGD